MMRCLLFLLPTFWASAHPADISHLRVAIGAAEVEYRFTLNLASIDKIQQLDADQDGKITFGEVQSALPAAQAFVKESTLVAVNYEDTDLGTFTSYDYLWPEPETSTLLPTELAARLVDIGFRKTYSAAVADVWLGFQWFDQLGDLHAIEGHFKQPGQPDTPVKFSVTEPEYLFDATLGRPAPPELKEDPPWSLLACFLFAGVALWAACWMEK
jgi:hypothetical protein